MRLVYLLPCLVLFFNTQTFAEEGSFSINIFQDRDDRRFIDDTIQSFMRQYQIPGLSIAIAKDGEIILAKGYGYADKDKKTPVNILHKFRIASISKPITAVAIMQLYEQGKLNLDDRVFGIGGVLDSDFPIRGSYIENITVRHLLEHTAAKEWTNEEYAPMFQRPDLSQTALIRWILNNRVLTEEPGTRYTYSNFGYCLLERIIEKVSGIPYKHYVKKNIFNPIGTKSFDIAKRQPANTNFEVRYYPDTTESPYWFPIARMAAPGGWVANAIDVVKFSMSIDGRGRDILNQKTIALMTTPSKVNKNYALGWNVNHNNNWWHNGSLPGTASIIVRTNHGFSWAVLLNKRSETETFFSELELLTWNLIGGIKALN